MANGDKESLNLTPLQRKAILKRDGYECQSQLRGRIHCSPRLEVDHLMAKRGAKRQGFPIEFINTPENLLTKCVNCHRGHPESHHPDAHKADWEYREGDKLAYKKMFEERERLLNEGKSYCNDTHLVQDLISAERLTKEMDDKNPNWWPWPRRNGRHTNGNGKH